MRRKTATDFCSGGKADMTFAVAVAIGVKRTCRFALQMSAFDPERTSGANTSHPVVALVHGYFSDFFMKRLLALGAGPGPQFPKIW